MLNWLPQKTDSFSLNKDYDLFFPVFNSPFELFCLNSIKDWRKKYKKAACYIVETWENQIPDCKYLLELLKDFDHIFIGHNNPVKAYSDATGVPCSYLLPGVDALKFCPYPIYPHRSIDISYLGRRSSITHNALVDMTKKQPIFYYYDTLKTTSGLPNEAKQITFRVNNANEHRKKLANTLKISRYFFANRANANEPDLTQGKQEISYRFFEGAASGTVMIGVPPATEIFKKNFDWQDAVIEIPFDVPNIAEIIADLDNQPERLAKIRKDNVVNSLLRHDWIYRWREVLDTVGIKPTAKMLDREAKLKNLADEIQKNTIA